MESETHRDRDRDSGPALPRPLSWGHRLCCSSKPLGCSSRRFTGSRPPVRGRLLVQGKTRLQPAALDVGGTTPGNDRHSGARGAPASVPAPSAHRSSALPLLEREREEAESRGGLSSRPPRGGRRCFPLAGGSLGSGSLPASPGVPSSPCRPPAGSALPSPLSPPQRLAPGPSRAAPLRGGSRWAGGKHLPRTEAVVMGFTWQPG